MITPTDGNKEVVERRIETTTKKELLSSFFVSTRWRVLAISLAFEQCQLIGLAIPLFSISWALSNLSNIGPHLS